MSGLVLEIAITQALKFQFLTEKSAGRLSTGDHIFPALAHGANGRRLANIINSKDKNSDQKIAEILGLLIQDQIKQDSKKSRFSKLFSPVGGFGKNSFKVDFIGTLIGANFAGCKTDADRKNAIIRQIKRIHAGAASNLKNAVTLFVQTPEGQAFTGIGPAAPAAVAFTPSVLGNTTRAAIGISAINMAAAAA